MAAASLASAALQHSYSAANHRSYSSVGRSPSTRSLPCKGPMRVRCQAEPAQTPPQNRGASTRFSDVLGFSGPAPERINGRLAMIGFVAAIGVELARGDDLAQQLMNGGLPWFAATAAVLSAASLVPLFKGVSVQSKSGGLMSADAEMWNGRVAMLGLVAQPQHHSCHWAGAAVL